MTVLLGIEEGVLQWGSGVSWGQRVGEWSPGSAAALPRSQLHHMGCERPALLPTGRAAAGNAVPLLCAGFLHWDPFHELCCFSS